MTHFFKQFGRFTYLQALCCIFAVVIFASLAITKHIQIPYLPRYDLILILCLIAQWLMIRSGLEDKEELKLICLFHVIGLALELFKTHMGSWSYPEFAYTKIAGVPLYSGFMYASVASYVCQAWKRFDLKIKDWPGPHITLPLGIAIYLNFFTKHFIPDLRWVLILGLFYLFRKTKVHFKVGQETYRMRLLSSFLYIGFFIWIAENLSTFLNAWEYPHQTSGWQLVHLNKLTSWALLIIVTIIIVATAKIKPQAIEEK